MTTQKETALFQDGLKALWLLPEDFQNVNPNNAEEVKLASSSKIDTLVNRARVKGSAGCLYDRLKVASSFFSLLQPESWRSKVATHVVAYVRERADQLKKELGNRPRIIQSHRPSEATTT